MITRRTFDFLPSVFKTETNRRFLNSTVDQLVQEPVLKPVNGFIGKGEGSPLYRDGDAYVQENDAFTQYYQFDPMVVINEPDRNIRNEYKIRNAYSYLDLLNSISAKGGIVKNHDRLFNQEYYNYQGFINLDKLVDYSQYYWVPSGPNSIDIKAGGLDVERTFHITRPYEQDLDNDQFKVVQGLPSYNFEEFSNDPNPSITLVRGGTYEFKVTQTGYPFYIQMQPGLNESLDWQANIDNREIKGVENNGSDLGTIRFTVPKKTAQDEFIKMSQFDEIDIVVDIPFNQIQNQNIDKILEIYKFDDTTFNYFTKKVVFTDVNNDYWYSPANFDATDEYFDSKAFDHGEDIPASKRKGIWQLKVDDEGIVRCTYLYDWPSNTKLFVKSGVNYGGRSIYKDSTLTIRLVPMITATLDTLYYQDGVDEDIFGIIHLVEPDPLSVLDINSILGQKTYTSPNGINFTNGLKVRITGIAEPEEYKGNEYIVEGVGTAITLTKWNDLITPEPYTRDEGAGYDATNEYFDTLNFDESFNSPLDKEYITISRNSLDGNAWSRGNRWFHKEVLNYTASILTPDNSYSFDEDFRAKRPIIEFRNNLQLFGYGRNYLTKVFVVDKKETDAFSNVEGSSNYFVDGVELLNGITIAFISDDDIDVRKTIYQVELIDVVGNNQKQIHLVPYKTASNMDNIVIFSGNTEQGKSYRWDDDNETWIENQRKSYVNQEPLFDLMNRFLISLSDKTYYSSSTFAGSKLFSYKRTSSKINDSELGFPITYKSINNIGDIVFDNNFDTDTFDYLDNKVTVIKNVSIGNAMDFTQTDNETDAFAGSNPWVKIEDYSAQYIERSFQSNISNRNDFDLDLIYENSLTEKNIFVTVNNEKVTNFSLIDNTTTTLLRFNSALNLLDKVLVRVYGLPNEDLPIYTVPKNLEYNSQNDTFETITLGQMRKHLTEICNNSLDFSGQASGVNNLRDIDYLKVPGTILQHSAPLSFSQILFNNDSTDVIEAINFNRREYATFKNKFFELLETKQFTDINNPRLCFDEIMTDLTDYADPSKPFYYSDMVAFGRNYKKTTYTVFDPNDKTYTMINSYNYYDGETSYYNDFLIYINNVQLTLYQDYTFDGRVITIDDNYDLQFDDVIEIYEYDSTHGCMIPATPSKMGMYPPSQPMIFEDTSYYDLESESRTVIQGHDGSITFAFNDFRDAIILEYELRVYNNIHVDYYYSLPSYEYVEPNAYGNVNGSFEYSLDEWTQLLSGFYLEWAGTNNIDAFFNNINSNSLFSLNYSEATSKLDGELLPGYWRGIYNYYYGTDRPHTHPWEIAGWWEKPSNWDNVYGPAPYTSGNKILWDDLENGIYYDPDDGERYVDPLFIRSGLTDILPVDEHGNLLPPQQTIVKTFNNVSSGKAWRFGDQSPQETTWRKSSEYPFAVIAAYHLAKPAEASAFCWNTKDYIWDQYRTGATGQNLNIKNNNRKFIGEVTTANDLIPGSNLWIRDRLSYLGLSIKENLVDVVNNFTVNLGYKLSGYTDKKYMQVLAEQASPNSTNNSVLVPQENYQITVTKSAPVNHITYSAVIIEKSGAGYVVTGFDTFKPYFTIIPSSIDNDSYTITVEKMSAIVYRNTINEQLVIPYGTTFRTRQQIVDFLIGYGRYLESQGFLFENLMKDSLTKNDFSIAAKEFLYFSQQGWDEKTVISLSPPAGKIEFNNQLGVVDNLTDSYLNTRIIDSSLTNVNKSDYFTYREGTYFSLVLKNENRSIFLMDIQSVQYEHAIIFDNVTVFNDTIYESVLGNRQQRLKLVGRKTADWDGSLYAPGFLVNYRDIPDWIPSIDYYKGDIIKERNKYYTASTFIPGKPKFDRTEWFELDSNTLDRQLVPTPTFNASQFKDYYDIDRQDINVDSDLLGRHSSGFQPRDYFVDIGLDVISQHKFYLGMINEKGTKSSIDKFLRAKIPYVENNIDINEEWAFKLGNFGGVANNKELNIPLDKIKSNNNIFTLEFLNKNDIKAADWNQFKPKDMLTIPTAYDKDIFASTEQPLLKYEDAGYPMLEDITATVFDVNKINNISRLAGVMGEGSRIWVSSDKDNDWSVYRASSNNYKIQSMSVVQGSGIINFVTTNNHNLQQYDKILIKNAGVRENSGRTTDYSGVYIVDYVSGLKSFTVTTNLTTGDFNGRLPRATFLTLDPVRFNSKKDIANYTPARGWKENDLVYVDNVNGKWQVLENTKAWTHQDTQSPTSILDTDEFGGIVKLSENEDYAVVSSNQNNGTVYIYTKDDFNTWGESENIGYINANVSEFSSSMDLSYNDKVFIGAPGSLSETGLIFVSDISYGTSTANQIIYNTSLSAGDRFGSTIAVSKDGIWLYATAEGADKIYVYKYVNVEANSSTYDVDGLTSSFDTPVINVDEENIKVYINNNLLIPYTDYTFNLAKDNITLTDTPENGSLVTIKYEDYYKFITTIDNPGTITDKFGMSLSTTTDGRDLLVSAHLSSKTVDGITYSNSGKVYVYRRTAENFISNADTTTFNTYYSPLEASVSVDGVESTEWSNTGSEFVFDSIPPVSAIVSIETNNFKLIETIFPSIDTEKLADLNFGYDLTFCPNNCSVYVGAPGYNPGLTNPLGIGQGSLFRYINIGRTYGTILGSVSNPTVTAGDRISINDYQITFTGGSIYSAVNDINNANIPGVSSFVENNKIKITTNSLLTFNKLKFTEDYGNSLTDLGLNLYPEVQFIEPTLRPDGLRFGEDIAIDSSATRLVISSKTASNKIDTTFDKTRYDNGELLSETTFDGSTTTIKSVTLLRSGASYLYEYQLSETESYSDIGKFAYASTFIKSDVKTNDAFGTSVAIGKNWTLITSPLGDINNEDKGTLDIFYNEGGKYTWNLIREQSAGIDSNKIKRAFIYNKHTNDIEVELPIVDSIVGKHLPDVIENIDFTTNYDPAVYNRVPSTQSFTFDNKNAWGKEHVGTLWWDTNSIRYLNWQQEDLFKKANLRDLLYPSSAIEIYQWIESDVPPAQFNNQALGISSLYTLSQVYTEYVTTSNNEASSVKYYFWVKLVPNGSDIYSSDSRITDLFTALINPRSTGKPFASIIASNALALYNCSEYVNVDSVLKIEYNKTTDKLPLHTEWSIFPDNTRNQIPENLYNKLVDSMAGQDSNGRLVPDNSLKINQRYGLDILPRQTMFIDNTEAKKLFADYMNEFFVRYPIRLIRNIEQLLSSDPYPAITEYNESVEDDVELSYLDPVLYIGKKVLVKNDSATGGWTLRELVVNDDESFEWNVLKAQRYNNTLYWEYKDWYAEGYNSNFNPTHQIDYNYEINKLKLKNNDTIKINNSTSGGFQLVKISNNKFELVGQESATIQISDNFFNSINAGFGIDSESFENLSFSRDNIIETRNIIDAIFKILNQESGVYVKEFRKKYTDLINLLINLINAQFIETDWLFKTSFISVKHNIRTLSQIPYYVKSIDRTIDKYIKEVKPYHTKVREYRNTFPGLDNASMSISDYDLPPYLSSYNNKYKSPQLEDGTDSDKFNQYPWNVWAENYNYGIDHIDILDGGSGYTNETRVVIEGDATAKIKVRANGEIYAVVVTNPGSYTTTPSITLNGPGSGAKLYAHLKSNKVRSIKTSMVFDRYTRSNTIDNWEEDTSYNVNDIFIYDYIPYRVIESHTSTDTFNFLKAVPIVIRRWENYTTYSKYDIVVKDWGNKEYYEVTDDFESLNIFDSTYLSSYTGEIIDNAIDRVWAYYNPSAGRPGRDLSQLMTGLEYPGVNVLGPTFDSEPGFDVGNFDINFFDIESASIEDITKVSTIDMQMYGEFTDANLGIRAEDIIHDGAGFVDEYNSHAPEELIPGIMFDALDIKVTTGTDRETNSLFNPPDICTQVYYGNNQTTFSFDGNEQLIGGIEKLFVRTKNLGFLQEGIDFTVDWNSQNIETVNPLDDDVIFIMKLGSTGENIISDIEYYGDGSTTVYNITNIKSDVGKQIYVKINGSQVTNYTLNESAWGYLSITFDTAPENNDYIQIHVFDVSESRKGYSSVVEANITVSKRFELDYYRSDVSVPFYNSPDSYDAHLNENYVIPGKLIRYPGNISSDLKTLTIVGRWASQEAREEFTNDPIVQENNYNRAIYNTANGITLVRAIGTTNEEEVNYPVDYTFELPEEMQYTHPWNANIVVRRNKELLTPANNKYYEGDGSSTSFSVPSTSVSSDATISDNDIVVVVNNTKQQINIDYTLTRDGSSLPIVEFNTAPADGDKIIISDSSIADYLVTNDNTVIIKDRLMIEEGNSTELRIGDTITIIMYSNHDMYDLRTEVFVGVTSTTVLSGGYDVVGYDADRYDSVTVTVSGNPRYTLSREVNNTDHLQVYRNGGLLIPNDQYILLSPTDLQLNINLAIADTDVIVVKHFSEDTRYANIKFRIFKDMLDQTKYLGIGYLNSTTLTRDLLLTDTTIYVKDSSRLSEPGFSANQPGVIFINGERITYWAKDDSTNTLTQIRRSTAGTGGKDHSKNSVVEDASVTMEIPDNGSNETWYDLVDGGQVGPDGSTLVVKTNGKGLQESTTDAAKFLRGISR